MARTLPNAGWSVVAASVSQSELDAFGAQNGIAVRLLDVTDQASVESAFSDLTQLDALVNCAGILLRGDEYDIDDVALVSPCRLSGKYHRYIPVNT